MRRFVRDNSLTLGFGFIFALALVGQALTGQAAFNHEQAAAGAPAMSLGRYLTSSSFAVDVAENWQSEYLQFFLYVFATVWLVQRGSTESKPPGQAGEESEREQKVGRFADGGSPLWARVGGVRTAVFARSLGLVMGLIFLLSWLAQSIAGRAAYNARELTQQGVPVSWVSYVSSADFWNRTLQNWQSEFLAVASMAVLSVYLRQRGSSESKPVGSADDTTGVEG